MKYIIVLICGILLPIFSLKEINPKLCINCKFFINSLTGDKKYGKCSFFPIVERENNLDYLVSGIERIEYFYCRTVRSNKDMCGKEGKMFTPLDI